MFWLLTIYTIFDEENKRKKKLNAFLLTLHGGTSLVCVLGLGTSLLHSTLSPQSAEDTAEEGEERRWPRLLRAAPKGPGGETHPPPPCSTHALPTLRDSHGLWALILSIRWSFWNASTIGVIHEYSSSFFFYWACSKSDLLFGSSWIFIILVISGWFTKWIFIMI